MISLLLSLAIILNNLFYLCRSQHFQEMSVKEGLFNVTYTNEAMIWLWRAHNIVNKRLAGDATEDPEHPKVQFPTQTQCRACFSGDTYFEPIIISFLHSFYGKAAMKLDALTEDELAAAAMSADGSQLAPVNAMVGLPGTLLDISDIHSIVPPSTGDPFNDATFGNGQWESHFRRKNVYRPRWNLRLPSLNL